MDPYATVADSYDIMIDWPARLERERPFFARLFEGGNIRKALDVGCGTGHHARLFAEMGATALGIDPSAPMVDRARALTEGDSPSFAEGGFAQIPTQPGPFDLITILGNTFAYVEDNAELELVIRNCRKALNPGGILVIQVVNYDRILIEGDRWLPLVQRAAGDREFLFLREYRLLGRNIEFTLMALSRDGEWRFNVERSRHYPVTADRVRRATQRAGFHETEVYGDYQMRPYHPPASPGLVVVARV